MKKYFFVFILICSSLCAFAQKNQDEEIILKSFDFLSRRFHLYLEKDGELIIVSYNKDKYIYDKYYTKDTSKHILQANICYTLLESKEEKGKYYFNLDIYSSYKGSFKLYIKNGKYVFEELSYVKMDR